ncbi:ester cyclase [Propionivibrio soli]|uniref:ester cyclase n=1 Tax=Propionivibrio soli TaxID=2976531 RepID=UPI0021E89453|nr:ester cyclase [Propionivibrio soli]
MTETHLARLYKEYIACLNMQKWSDLGRHVHDGVVHNGKRLGLAGYQAMLENDFASIPDLHFNIELLVADSRFVASRLAFNCTPRGRFMNLDIDGLTVSFSENVFYEFTENKILRVWSVIDKAAIEAQLPGARQPR